MNLPDASKLPYWKSGHSSPESWVQKARAQLEAAGATVDLCLPSMFQHGRTAHVIGFSVNGDSFKLIWPVLAHDPDNELAAIRQAATMLFHDVKARCVKLRVFGARWAFHAELILPDGRAAGQLTTPELVEALPPVALLVDGRPNGSTPDS